MKQKTTSGLAIVAARKHSKPAKWRAVETEHRVAENGDSVFMEEVPRALSGLATRPGWLFAVADGLGGEGNDDVASQTAVETLGRLYRGEEPLGETELESPDDWLRTAYDIINRRVCEVRLERKLQGVFTTLTTALIVPTSRGSLQLFPANIGDSRIYLLRGDKLTCVTRDDGDGGMVSRVIGDPDLFCEPYLRFTTTVARTAAIEDEITRGLERELETCIDHISPAQARSAATTFLALLEGAYPMDLAPRFSSPIAILADTSKRGDFSTLVSKITFAYIRLASLLAPIDLMAGDRLLLCSDGISNAFDEPFLKETLARRSNLESPEEGLDDVMTCLMEAPGLVDDDRTAVLVQIEAVQ